MVKGKIVYGDPTYKDAEVGVTSFRINEINQVEIVYQKGLVVTQINLSLFELEKAGVINFKKLEKYLL